MTILNPSGNTLCAMPEERRTVPLPLALPPPPPKPPPPPPQPPMPNTLPRVPPSTTPTDQAPLLPTSRAATGYTPRTQAGPTPIPMSRPEVATTTPRQTLPPIHPHPGRLCLSARAGPPLPPTPQPRKPGRSQPLLRAYSTAPTEPVLSFRTGSVIRLPARRILARVRPPPSPPPPCPGLPHMAAPPPHVLVTRTTTRAYPRSDVSSRADAPRPCPDALSSGRLASRSELQRASRTEGPRRFRLVRRRGRAGPRRSETSPNVAPSVVRLGGPPTRSSTRAHWGSNPSGAHVASVEEAADLREKTSGGRSTIGDVRRGPTQRLTPPPSINLRRGVWASSRT